MTFLEELQAHKGGLIRLKSELYWYGGRGLDKNPGRVCLVLDARLPAASRYVSDFAAASFGSGHHGAGGLLLIDGRPQWVWVSRADVEFVT
jgi:hypothetical protein